MISFKGILAGISKIFRFQRTSVDRVEVALLAVFATMLIYIYLYNFALHLGESTSALFAALTMLILNPLFQSVFRRLTKRKKVNDNSGES
jgi:phage shock protein PspC (stress-responsive transcriptional regulator)